MIGGIDLTKWTNDELYQLYGQILAELAKRNTGGFTVKAESVSAADHGRRFGTDSTMQPPAKPYADVWCGMEARP